MIKRVHIEVIQYTRSEITLDIGGRPNFYALQIVIQDTDYLILYKYLLKDNSGILSSLREQIHNLVDLDKAESEKRK